MGQAKGVTSLTYPRYGLSVRCPVTLAINQIADNQLMAKLQANT